MTPLMPTHVLVAGGGVAGLETTLALRDLAGDRVRITVLTPSPEFTYNPMTVAQPFSAGSARRYPLAELAADADAELVVDGVASVDVARRTVRTTGGREIVYDVLVLATGAGTEPAFARALTFLPDDTVPVGGLLRDIEQGYCRRVAVVIPDGPHWVLPAYELALLIAEEAYGMGRDDLDLTLVTPERAPLELFGSAPSTAVAADLAAAGITVETGARAELHAARPSSLILQPGARVLEVDRILALPRIVARPPAGVPTGTNGFLAVDGHGRVPGAPGVYAAGDGTAFPIKHGGLAAQQADAVARHIASELGADVVAEPFTPVLRGRLLTGRHKDRWLRGSDRSDPEGRVEFRCLWWPPGKIGGRYLAPYLAARDDALETYRRPPAGGALEVHLSGGHDVELLGR